LVKLCVVLTIRFHSSQQQQNMKLAVFFGLLALTQAFCPNGCSGHGSCGKNDKCSCYARPKSTDPAYTNYDCSERTCPKSSAWVDYATAENSAHLTAECSAKGACDRKTGECKCFDGYDGKACERTVCPGNCNGRGRCITQMQLAYEASKTYSTPWDSVKHVGCVCDMGARGPDCSLEECPSGADVMEGQGSVHGRDCSGRGMCDYSSGICSCFSGHYGAKCQFQTVLS